MKKKLITIGKGITFLFVFLVITVLGLNTLINSRTFQLRGEIIPQVETTEKVVALTFDDGPNEKAQAFIDLLNEKQVPTTFFLIGSEMEKHPEETKALVTAGHEIGNHSFNHKRMVFKSEQFIKEEIEKTDLKIRNAGYQGDIHFRPPYGKKLVGLPNYLVSNNRKTIMWDVEPDTFIDKSAPASDTIQYVKANTKPGSIILIHPWNIEEEKAKEIISGVIDELKNEGYTFVTVNQLLEM